MQVSVKSLWRSESNRKVYRKVLKTFKYLSHGIHWAGNHCEETESYHSSLKKFTVKVQSLNNPDGKKLLSIQILPMAFVMAFLGTLLTNYSNMCFFRKGHANR